MAHKADINMVIAQYLSSISSLRPNTINLYRNGLQRLQGYCNWLGMDNVDLNNFQEYMPGYAAYLESLNCGGPTIQQYLTIAKMFFKWNGTPIEYTYRIPASERKEAQLKAVSRWFTEIEVEMCREYSFPDSRNSVRNQAIVCLLIDTGARVREVSRIMSRDVDLENRTVFLSDSKTEPRPAFFSKDTARILLIYKERAMLDMGWQDRIFPSTKQVQKIINDMLIDLGLKNGADGRGPHTFRHYVATWLHYEGGMSIMDIAFLLGDTPKTIEDNYIHPTPNMLQRRVDAAMGW